MKYKTGMKQVYIAGPMRRKRRHNFPAFDAAALALREQAIDVINPAELDRVAGLHDWSDPPSNAVLRERMAADTEAITQCDGIVLLPDWRQSEGVIPEVALAVMLGLTIEELSWVGEMAVLNPITVKVSIEVVQQGGLITKGTI